MEKTDRQTDKTTRWCFTAYEAQWPSFEVMPELVAEWGWQKEICPETQRPHYQGYIRTKRQVRFSQIKTVFPGVHIEPARNWEALLNYCKKSESAVKGSQVHQVSTSKALTMAQAMTKIAANKPYLNVDWSEVTNHSKIYETEFWEAVTNILNEDPDSVGLYTQPQYMRAWLNTRTVWINLSQETIDIDDISPELISNAFI